MATAKPDDEKKPKKQTKAQVEKQLADGDLSWREYLAAIADADE